VSPHRDQTGRSRAPSRRDAVVVDVELRALTENDVEHVKWVLYEAVSWNHERQLPPYESLIEHPELARYHDDWGRPGDLGVVAELDGEVVGVAFCRLFTEGDHGHGYVDDRTPELAVAVVESHRGRGLGTRLMRELADAARSAGVARLSLSVDADNPALTLYERLGYQELERDDGGVRMLLDL
jgi:ribosomal protein S18 acetylase RimI-like enzyme